MDILWKAMPETEIVAVADANPAGLTKAKDRLKVEAGFADYREMLKQVAPDIVAIGARHIDQHRDFVVAAAEAGARGIYMEKPFCRTLAEADEMIAACDKSGTKLALAHRNRYHPALPAVQRLVADGGIGQLLEIRARGKEDQRGGALDLWVLGSHELNLLPVFAGQPLACTATLLQDGRPVTRDDIRDGAEGVGPIGGNALHARWDMAGGVPAYFDSHQNAGVAAANFGLQLIGTKGLIDLRIDTHPIAHLVPGNPFLPAKEPRPWIPISSAGPGEPEPIADAASLTASHRLAARDLLAAIRENRPPLCGIQDARLTVEMILATFESHRLGGQRVAFPLSEKGNPLAAL
jgi:predicted dehydrogenase